MQIDTNPPDPFENIRQEFSNSSNNNVFIIMRFGQDSQFLEIETSIKDTLNKFDLKGILAKDVQLHNLLWNNVQYCMDYSRYSIVVFERLRQPEFNPNVSLELGYMLALKRPCLLLKEKSMPVLPSDIVGHLYTPFNMFNIKESINQAVEKWLMSLGHHTIKPAEIFRDVTGRTQRIVKELQNLLESENFEKSSIIIRQGASLSSFAISGKELHDFSNGNKYKNLLIKERDLLTAILRKGSIIRVIITPDTQIGRIKGGLVEKDFVIRNILTRYDQLVSLIKDHLDNPNFQIVFSHSLSHQNILILNEKILFNGRRRVQERGFPTTNCIFDQGIIKEEINEFDILFWDNVSAILKTENPDHKTIDHEKIKRIIIDKLNECKKEIASLY